MPILRVPIAAGRGLDRATGTVAQNPANQADARNVYARDAKVSIRPGMSGTGFPSLVWGTDIIGEFPIKATLDEILVVYDRSSRQIRVFRLDTINGILQTIATPAYGLWGTLNADAEFPVVVAGESNGLLFLAHCEPVLTNRLACIYYTPDDAIPSNVGTLTTYTAALSDTGIVGPIYPSFVFAYLEYLCFAGYGSDLDPDRGDIVRMSQPQAPLDLRPPNYFYCGVAKDPIIALGTTNGASPVSVAGAVAAGQATVLVIAKTDECYVLNGTSFDNFMPTLLDPRYGVVSPRAFQNVGGVLYGWSSDGARRFTAVQTVPIAQPLELISPLPNDFPALGPSRLCFSIYDLTRYRLSWVFPDSDNASVPVACFTLSLWNPADPRWSFDELQQPVCCAGLMVGRDTGTPLPPPIGWLSGVTADDTAIAADPRYRSITVQWTNNEATGTEIIQIFARPLGGAWGVVRSVAVIAYSEQSATWDTALPVTFYDVALRYVNGTLPGAGYESNDPDLWTATTAPGAKTTLDTSAAPVAWVSGNYGGSSVPVVLLWASAQQFGCYLLEKSTDGGATYTTVVVDLVQDGYLYPVVPAEIGTTVKFRLTAQRGAVVGPTAGTLDVFMGIVVAQPVWISGVFNPGAGQAALSWNAATNALQYLLEKSTDGGTTWTTVATVSALTYNYSVPPAEINTTVDFRLTGQNGAINSVVSATEPVVMTFAVGGGVMASASFTAPVSGTGGAHPVYGAGNIAWNSATAADQYILERNVGGAGWATITTTAATSYTDPDFPFANCNVNVQYRVTPRSATYGVNGATSASMGFNSTVALTHTITAASLTTAGALSVTYGPTNVTLYIWVAGVYYGQQTGYGSGSVIGIAPQVAGTVCLVAVGQSGVMYSLPFTVVAA